MAALGVYTSECSVADRRRSQPPPRHVALLEAANERDLPWRAMPALTMRGRYLMREYWSDSDLFLRLSADERELYIGLWMLADDAGWLPRDVPAIAASLYRYLDRAPRELAVRSGLDRLRDLGKLTSLRCCLFLPAVARYPRAGKKTNEHEIEHRKHSNGSKDIQTHSNLSPVPSLPDPSLPVVARAPETARGGPMTSLGDAMQAAGGFAAELIAKKRENHA